ncbi:MAG: 50S ribosomal protein L23 [Hyphomonadaceae bacterium]|nr:50S ribosomal protein L23 [Clostridia bacterium]
MKNAYDIIKRPVISEHSMDQIAQRKYTFEVALDANKIEIKQALEAVFGVKIERVNTMRVLGKIKKMGAHSGKRPDWKKAIVKLTADSKTIEIFEGMS